MSIPFSRQYAESLLRSADSAAACWAGSIVEVSAAMTGAEERVEELDGIPAGHGSETTHDDGYQYRFVAQECKTEMCWWHRGAGAPARGRSRCRRDICRFAHHHSELRLRPERDCEHLGALRMLTYWIDRRYGRAFFSDFYGPYRAKCANCAKSFDIVSCEYLAPVCSKHCEEQCVWMVEFGVPGGHDIADCEIIAPCTMYRWPSFRYMQFDGPDSGSFRIYRN